VSAGSPPSLPLLLLFLFLLLRGLVERGWTADGWALPLSPPVMNGG